MPWSESFSLLGPTGPTGAAGATGAGHTGATGVGAAGATGATGPAGATGAGHTGATGVGTPGATGATGAVGATGAGHTGATGVGITGATGASGPTGPIGATGAAGLGINFKGTVPNFASLPSSPSAGDGYLIANEADRLVVWDAGSSTWVDGGSIQGPAGPAGATGATGAAGSGGATGATGVGSPGATGATGVGSPGATGATGPAGATGAGSPGATGATGVAGSAGATGATGAGTTGATGARGSTWYAGTGAPPASIPGQLVDDLYLDLASGLVYKLLSGTPVGSLPAIGASFQGGFYGGLISQSANGVPTHALIVSPAGTGQVSRQAKTANTASTGASSTFDGFANCEATNNASHPAAQWARALTIGGYTDWYIPALYEQEILYRNFKPDNSEGNVETHGANAFAVPSPTGNYTLSVPTTTAVPAFQLGNPQAYFSGVMGTSTHHSATTIQAQDFYYGNWDPVSKSGALTVRAIRKIPVIP